MPNFPFAGDVPKGTNFFDFLRTGYDDGTFFGRAPKGIKLPPGLEPFVGGLQDLTKNFLQQGQQKRYFTPSELASYLHDITQPATQRLERAYAPLRERATADYANRGQLFGGSLTGALAGVDASYGENLADILARAEADVSGIDVQYGAQSALAGQQRALDAQQIIAQLIQQYLAGQFGIAAAKAGKPGFGFNIGLPGGAGIGIRT